MKKFQIELLESIQISKLYANLFMKDLRTLFNEGLYFVIDIEGDVLKKGYMLFEVTNTSPGYFTISSGKLVTNSDIYSDKFSNGLMQGIAALPGLLGPALCMLNKVGNGGGWRLNKVSPKNKFLITGRAEDKGLIGVVRDLNEFKKEFTEFVKLINNAPEEDIWFLMDNKKSDNEFWGVAIDGFKLYLKERTIKAKDLKSVVDKKGPDLNEFEGKELVI